MIRFLGLQFCLSVLLLCCCGCPASNDGIGTVEGVVTLDGNPVSQVSVMFFPQTGRASMGTTDDNGHYKLLYTRSVDGAVIGEHKVTISPEPEEDDDDRRNEELIPSKYVDQKTTDLTATVSSGKNTFNFDLKSK